ncbi:MAG: hypothetical protein U0441_17715 [Polyangiaceae bacterium]
MKIGSVLGAALAVAVTGNAAALDVGASRDLVIDGPSGLITLAQMEFLALGADGPFCDYLVVMGDPTNPNNPTVCVIQERRTAFAPSCILNEQVDIVTSVIAGPLAGGTAPCELSDIKGETHDDVGLVLTEGPDGLRGIQIIQLSGGLPLIYPVRTN